jgi:phosphatidate phosphatase APP1
MENLKKNLIRAARKAHEVFDELKDRPSKDPIKIEAYTGYASGHRMLLKGRVLEDDNIMVTKSYEELKRIFYSFKRFETDEVPGVKVNIYLKEHQFQVQTDEEGFFTLDIATPDSLNVEAGEWIRGYAELPDIIGEDGPVRSSVKLRVPENRHSYGVISDVDDTILQTHVTSLFQLKMMFVTMFKEASQRLAMEGMVELYQEMAQSPAGGKNPFFYVSNSPWNIYPMLIEFLKLQELPSGPVLLRDFGLGMLHAEEGYRGHKIETISRIFKAYPDMEFLLFGDSGSKDADVYLTLAREFPGQIKTIYIRHLKNNKNARRVANLINQKGEVDAKLIHNTNEIVADAREKGYVRETFSLSEPQSAN